MKTSIFIRSYDRDFEWLNYCLRSIQKYTRGFDEIVIAVPDKDVHRLSHLTAERVVGVHDGQPGYLCQQRDKLNADIFCKGDYILHMDSDMVFTDRVTPEFFFRNGKPVWVITPFDEAAEDEKKAWLHVMVKCIREMPKYEFMRKCAILIPRWLYPKFRDFVKGVHKMDMTDYVMQQPALEFSEYNCLGFYAWLYQREHFHWFDTSIDGVPKWPWAQRWSWGGLTQEIRNEIEMEIA